MGLHFTKDQLAVYLDEVFPQVKGDFGIDVLEEDRLVLRMFAHDKHLRPGGTFSGPAMFALADCAIYMAVLARIGREALAVTTNASIDFMRKPVAGADLLCEARLLKLGRVLAVGDVLVYSDGDPKPVARASLTYSIPPK